MIIWPLDDRSAEPLLSDAGEESAALVPEASWQSSICIEYCDKMQSCTGNAKQYLDAA
jgi:hypothetical protein